LWFCLAQNSQWAREHWSVLEYHSIASVDTTTQWREDWSLASVVNHTIVTDPTIRQPGF